MLNIVVVFKFHCKLAKIIKCSKICIQACGNVFRKFESIG